MAAGAGATDWEDVFSDELCLSERFTAHSGTAGTQTPVKQPAASRTTRIHVQRDGVEQELRDQSLKLVATYDLTVDPRRWCIQQICDDKDYKQMGAEDAARLRKADSFNSVEFWTTKKSAHGGFRHQFDELLGSMEVAAIGADTMKSVYYKVEESRDARRTTEMCLGPLSFQQCTGEVCSASAPWNRCKLYGTWRAWVVSLAGTLFNFVFVCADVDVKMLRVRESCCTVACCVGVRVQASSSGWAHVLRCAHVPCCGRSLQPRVEDATARPTKCERTCHPSNWRSTACTQLRADPTDSNRTFLIRNTSLKQWVARVFKVESVDSVSEGSEEEESTKPTKRPWGFPKAHSMEAHVWTTTLLYGDMDDVSALECPLNYWLVRSERHERRDGCGKMQEYVA